MLIQKLKNIINILNELTILTENDIQNIKQANHEAVFSNTTKKENLSMEFYRLKNEIDKILVERNKPLEEIFSKEEEILFDEFREKLNLFYEKHKKFSKLAISVANFYNALCNTIQDSSQISYNEHANFNSKLKIKA